MPEIVDDFGFVWRPVPEPKTQILRYVSIATLVNGEITVFWIYKHSGWQEKRRRVGELMKQRDIATRFYGGR